MKNVILNISAVIIGLIIGSTVNMSLINISGSIIPPPQGIDVTTEAGLLAAMELFEPKHFIFPFLAHAVGTFVGAFLAALIAKTNRKIFALVIGGFFLLGGIYMTTILPSPLWFNLTDVVLAYIPMAFLGYKLSLRIKK